MIKHVSSPKDLSYLRIATVAISAIQVLSFLLLTLSGIGGVPPILSSYFLGSILVLLLFGLLPFGLGLGIWLWRQEFPDGRVGLMCVAILVLEVVYLVAAAIVNFPR